MKKKVYTEEDIENEVHERVAFKLNDIKSCIKNNLNRCKYGFYDGKDRRVTEESWTALNEIFKKEIDMPVPCGEMYLERKIKQLERKRKQKDEFIDDVMEMFDIITLGYGINSNKRQRFIKMLVAKIEKVQRDD